MPSFFYEAINSYLEQNVLVRTSTQNKQTQKNPSNQKMLPLSSHNFASTFQQIPEHLVKLFWGLLWRRRLLGQPSKHDYVFYLNGWSMLKAINIRIQNCLQKYFKFKLHCMQIDVSYLII